MLPKLIVATLVAIGVSFITSLFAGTISATLIALVTTIFSVEHQHNLRLVFILSMTMISISFIVNFIYVVLTLK